ncbi:MAG: GAF domain-containing protein [Bacteroidota bacterium]|nr:GAF domain-containing protein [Bacteroidota bacterium]MDP4233192.1 GAF domain-containing protein [Bacteroidota bacterium]MDP4242189.1 GAF domain-containing protein [Bacteroidota bacterium]MDP4287840.1 GAF domain-containing protein [Bacteroidota bacterium]
MPSLSTSLRDLISPDEPLITALSNAAALLYTSLDRMNWCGFYLFNGEQLVLGPFGGKPACTVIPMGKGVCGTAAMERRIIRVADVNEFPGHIACDPASQSEIVLPIILSDGRLFGVLDIDAPMKNRFGGPDERELASVIAVLTEKIELIAKRTGDLWRMI